MSQIPFASPQSDLEAMFAPTAFQNPYPLYERVRRHGNVLYLPEWNSAEHPRNRWFSGFNELASKYDAGP
jgi:hypothetical protein